MAARGARGLRIVAGELRGRRIEVPRGPALRPTSEKVREALFDILAARVSGATVLDLYAGSGALGIEALSRGALRATFVEEDRKAAAVLAGNLERLGLEDRSRIVQGEALTVTRDGGAGRGFDLVLGDPPYALDPLGGLLELAGRGGLLAPGGILVVELDAGSESPERAPGELVRFKQPRYGGTRLVFYRRETPPGGG